ncbi:MAG TPA: hypothetical protein VGO91_04670 [Pyrinomonadaceae bacterium]|jgi:hypothetical protein|nr:hypothetical protein [Pyrinomonadaceae bacterium]
MNEETTQQVNELPGALTPSDRAQFMPAMSIELAVERYNTITEFVSRVLRRDVDYGVIPGTEKLTLLKPGAEKLTTFFGLSTHFQLIERIEDWTGDEHHGEPFFYYLYRCQLFRGDLLIAEADGSCNSREQKYRWREQQRTCPECKQAAIIKGREEYGGGWLCFKKKGGCGAKFSTGDAAIEGQPVGRVPNPEIADQVNTIQKMGQKRALVAATLMAVNASEFFTQDMEDMLIPTAAAAVVTPSPSTVVNSFSDEERVSDSRSGLNHGRNQSVAIESSGPINPRVEASDLSVEILAACRSLGKTEDYLVDWLGKKYQADSIASLTPLQQREVLSFLRQRIATQAA